MARLTFRDGRFEVEVEWKDQSRETVQIDNGNMRSV